MSQNHNVNQNYGALRIMRVRLPTAIEAGLQEQYPKGWIPEERLVHLLTRSKTTIGRALNNDVFLMDPTVSREHALLVHDEHGWRIYNLTAQNVVRVNGRPVPGGGSTSLQPQDFLVLGSTMLQLIAPRIDANDTGASTDTRERDTTTSNTLYTEVSPDSPCVASEKQDGHHNDTQNAHFSILKEIPPTIRLPEEVFEEPSSSSTYNTLAEIPSSPRNQGPVTVLPWSDGSEEEDRWSGIGVTMQFALSSRMGAHVRWLIGGIGVAILTISALITVIVNSLIGLSAFDQAPSNLVAALTVPLIPALAIVLLANFMDRFEREPWFLQLAAFLWGAIIAIPPSRAIEQYMGSLMQGWLSEATVLQSSIFYGLNAGIPEEAFKGLGLVLFYLFLRDEFDNITDGIVYGALIGAGFAMVENFDYFARNSKDFFWLLIIGRVILGWLSHSTFTICIGVALGYIRHRPGSWQTFLIPLVGYLIAVALHSVFDFVDYFAKGMVVTDPNNPTVAMFVPIAIIANYIPPFIAQLGILYLLIKSLTHEAAVIREFLAQEVSSGVVQVGEYALLQNSFQRTREEWHVFRQHGYQQWLRVRALYQTEIGLAFRKWHVSMGDKPKPGNLQPEDAYRQRIKLLRLEITEKETT